MNEKTKGFAADTSNIIFVGFGMDGNGNSIAKFKFPNSRTFSIQTNGNLPETHTIKRRGQRLKELTVGEILTIISEGESYIVHYGTKSQRSSLRLKKKW